MKENGQGCMSSELRVIPVRRCVWGTNLTVQVFKVSNCSYQHLITFAKGDAASLGVSEMLFIITNSIQCFTTWHGQFLGIIFHHSSCSAL